ncbi:hypothetical protein HPB50_002760 [Hyalomma asiaticum]|uniref:Uncharacterized protein n=1 Tax=Hyalomma asiaticum TaxID=266040 RepID=A0ACB7S311_HYAAI|nr:hypothetical protein HPB50_002760 [Hyalomma asiaticum]
MVLNLYMRTGRESDPSRSSSTRSKRKRMRRASTSSLRTFLLTQDVALADIDSARKLLTGDSEVGDVQEGSRRQRRGPHRDPCLRDSSVPPRHAPRCTRQPAANSFKNSTLPAVQGDDSTSSERDRQVELHLSTTAVAYKPDEDPREKPRRAQNGRRLERLAWRKNGIGTALLQPFTRCLRD